MEDPFSEGRLRIIPAPQESNISPRSRSVTARDQNNFFHMFDSQLKIPSEREAAVNVLHHPFPECALRERVFTASVYWE